MKHMWRFCAATLIGVVLATNAVPFVALAQTSTSNATSTPHYPPPSCGMSVRPPTIAPGGSVTLTWGSGNSTGGTITGVGPVGPGGSINLLPSVQQAATTFVGTFWGLGGTTTCQATVQIVYGADTAGGTGASSGATGDTGGGGFTVTTQNAQTQNATIQSLAPAAQTTQAPAVQPQNSGLVPCGTSDNINSNSNGNPNSSDSTGCQACNLAQLIQNIINFVIGLSIPIAAALFAYAGVLYFTSASRPDNIGKAKRIFKDAFIGFLITITAWLVVDTLLHVLFAGTTTGQAGSWFTIECDTQSRAVNSTINNWLNSVLPSVNTTAPPVAPANTFDNNFSAATSQFTPGCDATNGFSYDSTSGQCINMLGDFETPSYSYSPAVSNTQMAQQLAAACSTYNMDSSACSLASAIAINESSGGNNCTTSLTGAVGCMQVLATTACSLDSTIDGCAGCSASRQSLSGACQPVIAAVSGNTQLGTNLGVQYINQLYQQYNGSCQLAAAAYFQGPGAVQKYGGVPPNAVSYVSKACGSL